MEEKHLQASRIFQKWTQHISVLKLGTLASQEFFHERNSFSLINQFKEKPRRTKSDESLALDIYLAEKILNDIRNLGNISSVKYSYFNNVRLSNHFQITKHFKRISSEDDKQKFYQIMLLSRESEEIFLASSNAATILNKIGFSFDNRDLKHIKIPYADLSKSTLIKIDFSYSDLRYVNFTSSLVAFCDFSNCEMSESKLEKLIFKSKDIEIVEEITFSKCGKYVASLKSMKGSDNCCSVSIFSATQSIEMYILPITKSVRYISNIKFSSDSSFLYILYVKKLFIWNFLENSHRVVKLQDKISYLKPAFNDTMLAYSIPDFIRIISLFTFKTLTQIEADEISVKQISGKYLLGKCDAISSIHENKYEIWNIESGKEYKNIIADYITICNDICIKKFNDVLEIKNLSLNEVIWKIRDEILYKHIYISSDNKFLASFKNNEIFIVDVQKQVLSNYFYFRESWYYDEKQNLFKLGFFRLKNKAKILKSFNFSESLEFKRNQFQNFLILFSKNTIFIYWLGLMKIINIETWAIETLKFPNHLYSDSVAVSYDLCICILQKYIEIWNYRTQKLISRIQINEQYSNIQISPEQNLFSVISKKEKSFFIYSIALDRIIHKIKCDYYRMDTYKFTGKHLIFALDKYLGIWDKKTDKIDFVNPGFIILNIEGSPCGRWAAFHNFVSKNEVIIWNIDTKADIKIAHGENELNKNFACFSPCGNYLATASTYDIIIWESATGIKIAKTGGLSEIMKFCYSQCGKYIVSYAKGDLILIWNAEEGLKKFERSNGVDLEISLNIDWAMRSNATVISGNNFSGVYYLDENTSFKY